MREYNNLIELIDKNDVVSFDIFDTLLLRNVQRPVDIFRIIEKEVEQKYKIKDFFQKRIDAEIASRQPKNHFETTLDEIYEALNLKNKKISDSIKKLELEIEYDFLIANPFMKKVFNYCREKNKKIVCISDMYLPLEFIQKVLNKNGYNDVKVYLSCVYKKHKGNGTLFEVVYNEEKFEKEKWIHIGDNYECDYVQAKNFGINSFHYPKVLDRSDVIGECTSVASTIINAIRNNEVNNGLDVPYWKRFGILNASPIYFAFANWCYSKNKDNDNLFFMARDGYIVKQVFDKICKHQDNKMITKYLYTSRRAIQLPMLLWEDKTLAVDTLCCINRGLNEKMKLKTVFDYFGMDTNKYINLIKMYGFESFEDEVDNDNFLQFKQMISEIYQDFSDEMKNSVELIKAYLEQEGIKKFKRINVVDIGWRGSVQYALSKIVEQEIFGYYFCTNPYVYYDIFYNTQGFLINYGNPAWLEMEVSKNIMLYEFLFSAPEGSLQGFKKEKGKIVPILSEDNSYDSKISELQESAIMIIDKYLQYYKYIKDITAEEAVWPYRNFISYKHYDDLLRFSEISTNVGYGGSLAKMVPVYSKKYILNKKEKFLDEIEKSMWNNTFVVKEIKTQEEYDSFKEELLTEKEKEEHKLLSLYNFKMALKHPIKAIIGLKIVLFEKLKKK